jgi:hypothetical protein
MTQRKKQNAPKTEPVERKMSKKDYINSIKKMNFCVKYLIEKVHFNPDKPENMNIYIYIEIN